MDSIFTFPGGGNLYTSYNGQGNNTVSFTADPNEGEEDRELMLTFRTYSNSMSTQRKVIQRGAEIGEYVFNIIERGKSSSGGSQFNISILGEIDDSYQFTTYFNNGVEQTHHNYANFETVPVNCIFPKKNLNNSEIHISFPNSNYVGGTANVTHINIYTNVPKLNLAHSLQNHVNNSLIFITDNTQITNLTNTFEYSHFTNTFEVNTFDTSGVESLHLTFARFGNVPSWSFLDNWDLSSVINGYEAFYNSSVDRIPKFLNLVNGRSMFSQCDSLTNFSTGDLPYLEDCINGFHNCKNLDTISFGNFNSLTDSEYMFSDCNIANSLTLGYMPALESSHNMFYNCNCPTIIMGSAGVNSSNMFYNCNHTYNITINDTSRLENASHMFNGCHNIVNLDSSNWTLSNLTNAANMFSNCINLQDFNTSHWNLTNLVDGSYMFYNCDGLTHFEAGDLEHMTTGYEGFSMCDGLNTVTIGNLPSLTSAVNMFYHSEFHHLTIGNMPAVTDIERMFDACVNAESINIGNLTSVINSQNAFHNCFNLSDLTLGNFDSLNNARGMFINCYNLTGNIYITCNNLSNAVNMFRNTGRDSTGFNVYAYEGTNTWNHLSYSNTYLNYGNLIPITD